MTNKPHSQGRSPKPAIFTNCTQCNQELASPTAQRQLNRLSQGLDPHRTPKSATSQSSANRRDRKKAGRPPLIYVKLQKLLGNSPAKTQIDLEPPSNRPDENETQQTKQISKRSVQSWGLGGSKIDFEIDFELLAEICRNFPFASGEGGPKIN